ncbi:MAG: lysophospholipid acyltransferase family protein [Phycisphaeraceae bacterium]
MLRALRRRQPGAPIWRILFWHLMHMLCYVLFVPLYRYRAFGVRNIPRTGPVLLVSNHQSYLDPIIVGLGCSHRQFAALARSTLFDNHPLFAWLIRMLNAIPVRQGESDVKAMRRCIEELEKGQALLIFPEGSRTPTGEVQPFETGTMLLIKRAMPPIVPVAIEGAYDVWKRGTRPKLTGRIAVMYGKPIPAKRVVEMGADRGLAYLREEVDRMRRELNERIRQS